MIFQTCVLVNRDSVRCAGQPRFRSPFVRPRGGARRRVSVDCGRPTGMGANAKVVNRGSRVNQPPKEVVRGRVGGYHKRRWRNRLCRQAKGTEIGGPAHPGSIISPRTIVTPGFSTREVSDPGRTIARIATLRSHSAAITLRPTWPVPPTTKTVLRVMLPCRVEAVPKLALSDISRLTFR